MTWPSVLLVADDITGALDSSAAFAARGLRVVVARNPDFLAAALTIGADVVAVSTQTREAEADKAEAMLQQMVDALRGCPSILFKKVDSRLKGNPGVETRLLTRMRKGPTIVCPAIPRLGRIVSQGLITGAGITDAIPVGSAFGDLAIDLADASDDSDLDHMLARPLSDVLLVGSAGLAEALARRMLPDAVAGPPPALTLPALFAVGTLDPTTLAQLHAMSAANNMLHQVQAPDGIMVVERLPMSGICVLQMTRSGASITPHDAAANFAETIAVAMAHLGPSTLFASGGECADAILNRLGAGLLDVMGEVLPGLPVCTANLCDRRVNIVTKSGGFGDPDTLTRLCNRFENPDQPRLPHSRPA